MLLLRSLKEFLGPGLPWIMAQPRRIQFITLSENEPLPAAPAPKVPKESKPETTVVETVTTVRFELQLFPSSENRCPEFLYPELVKVLHLSVNLMMKMKHLSLASLFMLICFVLICCVLTNLSLLCGHQAHETQKRPKTLEEVDAENEKNELEALARKFEAKYVSMSAVS